MGHRPPPPDGGRGKDRHGPRPGPPPEVIIAVIKTVFDQLSVSPNATAINQLIASKNVQTITQLGDLLVQLITTFRPPANQGGQVQSRPGGSGLQKQGPKSGPVRGQSGQGQTQKGGPKRGPRGQTNLKAKL